jgi:putative membrane protein
VRVLVWWATNFAALWVAARLVAGIRYDDLLTLALAALVFGLVNLLVRPLLVLLALPAVILTLGIALLAINALMLLLTDVLVPRFEVADFFWAAILGALIVWAVNMALHAILPERD